MYTRNKTKPFLTLHRREREKATERVVWVVCSAIVAACLVGAYSLLNVF